LITFLQRKRQLIAIDPLKPLLPWATSLHLSINESYDNKSYRALAAAVLSNASYGGSTIVISWHHSTLPSLARALGARRVPKKWPSAAFNLIWQLTYDAHGVATLREITEPF
jgi:hypothetical protein